MNTNAKTSITNQTLSTFVKRVNTICDERKNWQVTAFKTANTQLYELLSQVYELYDSTKDETMAAKKKRDWLVQQCDEKQLRFKHKNPTMIQRIVKLVFTDAEINSRRISSYSRVLTAAAQSPTVNCAADVVTFIEKLGGIEEVRASLSPNSKSPSKRYEEGKELANYAIKPSKRLQWQANQKQVQFYKARLLKIVLFLIILLN